MVRNTSGSCGTARSTTPTPKHEWITYLTSGSNGSTSTSHPDGIKWTCHAREYDLVAVVTHADSVQLHRHHGNKAVWTYAPDAKITSLCWSPCGQHLAVGLATGVVMIVGLQSGNVVHELPAGNAVVAIDWIRVDNGVKLDDIVPDFPPFANAPTMVETTNSAETDTPATFQSPFVKALLKSSNNRSCLVVVRSGGETTLYADGVTPIATLPTTSSSGTTTTSMSASPDCRYLVFVDRCAVKGVALRFANISSHLDCPRSTQIARQMTHCLCAVDYLKSAMEKVRDGWQDTLVDVNDKLYELARQKAMVDGGTVADDLIVLLICGTASAELEQFLMHSMGDKGLTRAFHSIADGHSTVLALLNENVMYALRTIMHACHRLLNILGTDSGGDKVGKMIRKLERSAGAALLKVTSVSIELETSRGDLLLLFTWLTWAVMDLANDQTSLPSAQTFDVHSHWHRLEGVINSTFNVPFREASDEPLFQLERVGQYLKDEPLKSLSCASTNTEYRELLDRLNPGDDSMLYPYDAKSSLSTVLDEVYADHTNVVGNVLKFVSISSQALRQVAMHSDPSVKFRYHWTSPTELRVASVSPHNKNGTTLQSAVVNVTTALVTDAREQHYDHRRFVDVDIGHNGHIVVLDDKNTLMRMEVNEEGIVEEKKEKLVDSSTDPSDAPIQYSTVDVCHKRHLTTIVDEHGKRMMVVKFCE